MTSLVQLRRVKQMAHAVRYLGVQVLRKRPVGHLGAGCEMVSALPRTLTAVCEPEHGAGPGLCKGSVRCNRESPWGNAVPRELPGKFYEPRTFYN